MKGPAPFLTGRARAPSLLDALTGRARAPSLLDASAAAVAAPATSTAGAHGTPPCSPCCLLDASRCPSLAGFDVVR
eukprot:5738303-Prymnesium_polylepis.1